jgi:hypothetical protein
VNMAERPFNHSIKRDSCVILSILLFSRLWIYELRSLLFKGGNTTVISTSRTIEEVGSVVNLFKTSGNDVVCRLLMLLLFSKDFGTFGILL